MLAKWLFKIFLDIRYYHNVLCAMCFELAIKGKATPNLTKHDVLTIEVKLKKHN